MEAEETFFFNLLKSFLQYFTTSVLVSGIQNGGARWLAFWVILWAPPLILDGYVMNDIWTIVKTKITCVTYRASPCGLAIICSRLHLVSSPAESYIYKNNK